MKFLLVFAILFANTALAGERIVKVLNPVEVKNESLLATSGNVPKEIEGLVWNRWTSKNFVVLAINNEYAKYLNEHLELVKTWTLTRWGLFDVDYSVQCKFICVDDPILFEKLFKLKKTKVEVRRDNQGRIKETVIFLLTNDAPSQTVPSPVTEMSLAEFGQRYNAKFNWCTYRGMSLLNGSLDQIRTHISNIKKPMETDQPIFFGKSLLEVTKEQYQKFTDEKKILFDSGSLLFCLMIRKEFGQDKFHHIMKDPNSEKALKIWLDFNSYNEFDPVFKRYITDLLRDISDNKTPNRYLQIYEPEKD